MTAGWWEQLGEMLEEAAAYLADQEHGTTDYPVSRRVDGTRDC